MPIDLYYISMSPPCRSVMMTAYLVGVDTNLKMLDLMAGEQMKPEFLKMNPMHKVPTIDDDGFYVTESQAICAYLVSKYAKNDSLYPTDPQQRALVDKMLNFDSSTFFPNLRDFYMPIALGKVDCIDEEAEKRFHQTLGFLDAMLAGRHYAAGDSLTIADCCLIATTASVDAVDDSTLDAYGNIKAWFNRCKKEIDHYEELNENGAKLHGGWIKNGLKQLKA